MKKKLDNAINDWTLATQTVESGLRSAVD